MGGPEGYLYRDNNIKKAQMQKRDKKKRYDF